MLLTKDPHTSPDIGNSTRAAYTTVIQASSRDVRELNGLLRRGVRPGSEHSEKDTYLNRLIPKPWGYEYRIFADELIDVWQLCLRPGQQTSMHAHPRKVTYLMVLRGQGVLADLLKSTTVSAGDVVRIERGAFHQTTNSHESDDLHLIKVETPRNKFDLMRLRDSYNRVGAGYETQSEHLDVEYRPVRGLPGASMSKASPCRSFDFKVTSGMDLHYRGLGDSGFHIPIGIGPFLAEHMPIIAVEHHTAVEPAQDAYYLSAVHT